MNMLQLINSPKVSVFYLHKIQNLAFADHSISSPPKGRKQANVVARGSVEGGETTPQENGILPENVERSEAAKGHACMDVLEIP